MNSYRQPTLYDAGVSKTVEAKALDRLTLSGRVTLGLLLPAENDWARPAEGAGAIPSLANHTNHLVAAELMGFRAAWFRDVPTFNPNHGDPGQIYDPWAYLGYLAALTQRMVLGTAGIVAPLEHDLHIAKRAASIDQLSGGRFVLGLATGDRKDEYGLFGAPYEDRGAQLRQSVRRLRVLWSAQDAFREAAHDFGRTRFVLAPRPAQRHLPAVIVGYAQQTIEWIARHGDGWFIYHDAPEQLQDTAAKWTQALAASESAHKPLIMPLRLILDADPNAPFVPFPMGARTGLGGLKRYLDKLAEIGIAHVALNLRLSERSVMDVLEEIAQDKDLIF